MNLTTPDKIRSLQRKLYCKAKAEPTFRFYLLYDKICREDILDHAYRLARANAGAPGVDGMTFARIEEQGLEAWLAGLRAELISKLTFIIYLLVGRVKRRSNWREWRQFAKARKGLASRGAKTAAAALTRRERCDRHELGARH
jgi:hypothetical protein